MLIINNIGISKGVISMLEKEYQIYELADGSKHLNVVLIASDYYFQRELPKKRIANLGGDGGGGNLEHILVFKH